MKQNKKMRKLGLSCLAAIMVILFSMPVMAADNSPELLVTKGESANQVQLSLTHLGDKAIKGFSLELKLTGGEAFFDGTIEPGSALNTEDTRVKMLIGNDGKEARLVITRKGQLPAGSIDIGALTVKGKSGEKYRIEASGLEMVDVSDYQKDTAAVVAADKNSDDNLVIVQQDTEVPNQNPEVRPEIPEEGQSKEDPANPKNPDGVSPSRPYGLANPSTGVITDPGAAAFVTGGMLIVMLAGLVALKRKRFL